MSTRSSIAIRSEFGLVYGIYCHQDGGPEWVGKTLAKFYQGRGDVWKLVRLGNLSQLGEDLELSVAHGRDWHREEWKAEKFSTDLAWRTWAANCDADFVYLYDESSRTWMYGRCPWEGGRIAPKRLHLLSTVIMPEATPEPPLRWYVLMAA